MTLDPCCGLKVWKEGYGAITMDILSSVKPMVMGSMLELPFRDNTFDKIVCDPPHLIRNDPSSWVRKEGGCYVRYGRWKTLKEWQDALERMNQEFFRVLKPGADLLLKIVDGKDRRVTHYEDTFRLTNFQELKVEGHKAKAPWSSNLTLYITYKSRKVS